MTPGRRLKNFFFWLGALALFLGLLFFHSRLGSPPEPASIRITSVSQPRSSVQSGLELSIEGRGFDRSAQFTLVPLNGTYAGNSPKLKTYGMLSHFILKGDLLYLANGDKGVLVAERSPQGGLAIQGTLSLPGVSWALALSGSYGFVATGERGLQIVDFSDPRSPRHRGDVAGIERAFSVAAQGNRVLVAERNKGLSLLDVSTPQEPKLLFHLRGKPGYAELHWIGDRLYVAGAQEGLRVFSTAGDRLEELPELHVPGSFLSLAVSGRHLYLVSSHRELQVVDLEAPAADRLIADLQLPSTINTISLAGDRAYVGAALNGLYILDISEPRLPRQIAVVRALGNVRHLAMDEQELFIASGQSGLHVIDALEAESHVPEKQLALPVIRSLDVAGSVAVAALKSGGLRVLDLRPEEGPEELAGLGKDVAVLAGVYHRQVYYFVDGRGRLGALDLSRPGFAETLFSVPLLDAEAGGAPTGSLSMAARGRRLYVATADSRVLMLGLRDDAPPLLLGEYEAPSRVQTLTAGENRLFLGCGTQGLVEVELSRIDNPRLLSTTAPQWYQGRYSQTQGLALRDHILYAGNGSNGIAVYDVRKPGRMKLLGNMEVPGHVLSLTLREDELYVASFGGGVFRFDVSDPERILLRSVRAQGLDVKEVALGGEKILIRFADGRVAVQEKDVDLAARGPQQGRWLLSAQDAPPPGRYVLQAYQDLAAASYAPVLIGAGALR